MGVEKDSLESLFSYFPIHNKQPKRVKRFYQFWPKINGDTIIFPNMSISSLIWQKEDFLKFKYDSSTFVMSHMDTLIQFEKVTGNVNVPSMIYLKKVSKEFPEKFQYQFVHGSDAADRYDIEIVGNKEFRISLRASIYGNYHLQLKELDSTDRLFINSYLNLVTENRYDTTDFSDEGTIFCGVRLDEKMVYNDSVFEYSTYVQRAPNARVLIDYFRSKVDSTKHIVKDFDLNEPSAKPKEFEHLPVAIERVWIAPPVEEIELEESKK